MFVERLSVQLKKIGGLQLKWYFFLFSDSLVSGRNNSVQSVAIFYGAGSLILDAAFDYTLVGTTTAIRNLLSRGTDWQLSKTISNKNGRRIAGND